jgi:hypothetical protein
MTAIILSFLGGVFTHFVAHWLIVYVSKGRSLNKMYKIISMHQAEKHLKSLNRHNPKADPHELVTADLVWSVYDLLRGKHSTALEALLNMADALNADEKRIAYDALKSSHTTNRDRELEQKYVEAMRKMLLET